MIRRRRPRHRRRGERRVAPGRVDGEERRDGRAQLRGQPPGVVGAVEAPGERREGRVSNRQLVREAAAAPETTEPTSFGDDGEDDGGDEEDAFI